MSTKELLKMSSCKRKISSCQDPIQGALIVMGSRNTLPLNNSDKLIIITGPNGSISIYGEPKKIYKSTDLVMKYTYVRINGVPFVKIQIYHFKYMQMCTDHCILALCEIFNKYPTSAFSTPAIGIVLINCVLFKQAELTDDKKKEIEELMLKNIKLQVCGIMCRLLLKFEKIYLTIKCNMMYNYITFSLSGELGIAPWMTIERLKIIFDSIFPDMTHGGEFVHSNPESYIDGFDASQPPIDGELTVFIDAGEIVDDITKFSKPAVIQDLAKKLSTAFAKYEVDLYKREQEREQIELYNIFKDENEDEGEGKDGDEGEDGDEGKDGDEGEDKDDEDEDKDDEDEDGGKDSGGDNNSFEITICIDIVTLTVTYRDDAEYITFCIKGVEDTLNEQNVEDILAEIYSDTDNAFSSDERCVVDINQSDITQSDDVLRVYCIDLFQFDGGARFFSQMEEIERIANAIYLDSSVQSHLASLDMQEKSGTQLLLDDRGEDVDNTTIVDTTIVDTTIPKTSGNKRGRDDAELMPPPKKWSSSYDAIIIAGDNIDDNNFDWGDHRKNFPLLFKNYP